MSLFKRNCPCCKSQFSLFDRAPLLTREPLICPYCAKALQPHFKISLCHTFLITLVTSFLIKYCTTLGFEWALFFSFLSVLVIQPAFNILFPLEEESLFD